MSINVYFEDGKKVNAVIHDFTLKTDQPVRAGGENTAPPPFSLFLASLATCAGFYVKAFCDQRNLPADSITLSMNYEVNRETHLINKFIIDINVPNDFPEKYDAALIHSAAICAVKKHLDPSIENIITIKRKN